MRWCSLGVVAALIGLGGGTRPVDAQTGTRCAFDFEWKSWPGYTMTPTSGTNHGSGTITCDGPVNGKQPTGIGTLSQDGRYGTVDGDTCFGAGEGDGVHTIEIPVAGGVEIAVSEFTYSSGGDRVPTRGGLKAASFDGTRFSGTFEYQPWKATVASPPRARGREPSGRASSTADSHPAAAVKTLVRGDA